MRTRSGRGRSHRRLAAAAGTTAVALAGGASPASAADCGAQAVVQPLVEHIYAAHLERSPLQQAKDLADIDDYALAHTVLVESMLAPVTATLTAVVDPLEAHIYAAHLERSPLQQAKDLADIDDYALAHTVLVESIVEPILNGCSEDAAPMPVPMPAHGSPAPDPAPTPAPAPAAPAPAPATPVDIRDYAFAPKTITVPAGTTVTWKNKDGDAHTVTGSGSALKSASIGKDATYSHTFAQAGTFTYFCSLHPQMKGTVLVH